MGAQFGSTAFAVWGRSSSFFSFIQDCVRGQYLCLAQVENPSSHSKTSEFWSLLTLFLRELTNYTQLCGRLFKKCPRHPFAHTLLLRAAQECAPLTLQTIWVNLNAFIVQTTGTQTQREFNESARNVLI